MSARPTGLEAGQLQSTLEPDDRPAKDAAAALAADLRFQQRMLERIIAGDPLEVSLTELCLHVERHVQDAHCTVLLLDRSRGVLRHLAAPTLPTPFVNQIDGLPVGEGFGACGTAAARREVVIVADIRTDPLTEVFVDLARAYDLGSVWSYPLVRAGGEVLGTFALYRASRHSPAPEELGVVAAASRLATLAVDRERSERALQEAVNVDPLTGLPNRARFLEVMNGELEAGRRISVMMVRLDRFGRVSQSVGEIGGDRLVVEVGERLRAVTPERGAMARFARDAFLMMVPALEPDGVAELTDTVTRAMRPPFHADGVELLLTASIGIATSGEAADAYALVREADVAMRAAQAGGPGHHQVYDLTLRARQLERLRTEAQLRRAIDGDELIVHYQPILRVADRRWSAVEALVRWQHPDRGLLGPDEFIPLAEETGLIVPLGLRVLEIVCRQARRWQASLPELRVAVNASPLELASPTMAHAFSATVTRHGLAPSMVTVEVTESALMEEVDTAHAVLHELTAAGVDVVIDDFGTGYSSLARLGELPISGLKIDRRFTRGLGRDAAALRVVRAIAELAGAYGLEVVVEGIEDAAALGSVDALGCRYAQGFHLGRPGPADAVESLLARALPQPPASPETERRPAVP